MSVFLIRLASFILTYFLVRIIFYLLGFEFNILGWPIDIVKLIIDLGTWVAVFIVTEFLTKAFLKTINNEA